MRVGTFSTGSYIVRRRREVKGKDSVRGGVLAREMIIMPSLGLAKRKIARQINSKPLEADAMETMLCGQIPPPSNYQRFSPSRLLIDNFISSRLSEIIAITTRKQESRICP